MNSARRPPQTLNAEDAEGTESDTGMNRRECPARGCDGDPGSFVFLRLRLRHHVGFANLSLRRNKLRSSVLCVSPYS